MTESPLQDKEQEGSKPSPNPNAWFRNDQAFWLPPGSFQALIVVLLIVGLVRIYVVHQWAPTEMVVATLAIIKDYISARSEDANRAERITMAKTAVNGKTDQPH